MKQKQKKENCKQMYYNLFNMLSSQ